MGRPEPSEDLIDVRRAAAILRRHPETVRRWVWSGRLVACRQGGRLLLARTDVEALAQDREPPLTLAEWAAQAGAARAGLGGIAGASAAELVLEDRARRAQPVSDRAGR